jgi:hypothetical protein
MAGPHKDEVCAKYMATHEGQSQVYHHIQHLKEKEPRHPISFIGKKPIPTKNLMLLSSLDHGWTTAIFL